MNEVDATMIALRKNLIESILSNPPNTADLRRIAENIMQIEKDNNLFDPGSWKGLL